MADTHKQEECRTLALNLRESGTNKVKTKTDIYIHLFCDVATMRKGMAKFCGGLDGPVKGANGDFSDHIGACFHTVEWSGLHPKKVILNIFLNEDYSTPGIIAHEFFHAVYRVNEFSYDFTLGEENENGACLMEELVDTFNLWKNWGTLKDGIKFIVVRA